MKEIVRVAMGVVLILCFAVSTVVAAEFPTKPVSRYYPHVSGRRS